MTIAPAQTIERGKRDKALRRQALIAAATTVFAERGFDPATTREIAERAGCAEGLIHRYFGGKRGLLLAILEARAGQVIEDFTTGLPDQPTVDKEIQRILLWHLDTMWERRDFMRVAVSQAAIDSEVGRAVNEGAYDERVRLINQKLRRHQQARRIRAEVDIEAIAHTIAILGFALGFSFQISLGQDRRLAHRTAIQAAAELSRGISRRSS